MSSSAPTSGRRYCMRLRILGSVHAVAHGVPLLLGSPRNRATLQYLALCANSVVSVDELLFALWRDYPPKTGRKMLQNAIAELRGVLAQDDEPTGQAVLLTHAPGYLLRIDPRRVDALLFARFAHEGFDHERHGDSKAAAHALRSALVLWPRHGASGSWSPDGWPEWIALTKLRQDAMS